MKFEAETSKKPMLSILTPAVPSRLETLEKLCARLGELIGQMPVEHLVLLDNKRRSVGLKRDALLRAARGKYVAFVDDDDWIADGYIFEILKATDSDPDVITFRQDVTYCGQAGVVEFRLGNPNEPFTPGPGAITRRNAWHVCPWRRSLAILSHFPDNSYGEDWAYASKLCALPGLKEVHIDKLLHFYRHDEQTTEAPPPM